jgi:enoyl-CoA hydratase/carnithine racemase
MLTTSYETDGERVLAARVGEAIVDAEIVHALGAVLDNVEHAGIENFVLIFAGTAEVTAGDFPAWPRGSGRADMRYFARWDELLSRISRLAAKSFAGYHGRVGPAAIQAGLVADLRLASVDARLSLGGLAEGRFPGMGAYWLPKFIGLGTARRMLLLGEDLTAAQAARIGLLDVVEPVLDTSVEVAIKALRPVTPEAACFSRRILNDSYLLEHSAAVELAKAARYRVGGPGHDG